MSFWDKLNLGRHWGTEDDDPKGRGVPLFVDVAFIAIIALLFLFGALSAIWDIFSK